MLVDSYDPAEEVLRGPPARRMFPTTFPGLMKRPGKFQPPSAVPVFNDTNGNGKMDSGETGEAGITVFDDQLGTGVLTGQEPSAVTGPGGNTYTLLRNPTGVNHITEVVPIGKQSNGSHHLP